MSELAPDAVSVDSSRPLVVTSDLRLLDDLLRLAAACGVELNVARDPVDARSYWSSAALVLTGTADAARCAQARLPGRPGIVVVARHPDDVLPGVDGNVLRFPLAVEQLRPSAPAELWRVAADLGAAHVVFLPQAERWLIDRLSDGLDPQRPAARVVGVVGGRGGAGASVLAAGLAVTAARQGLRSLLIDADPLGGGLDLVLGRESSAGVRWPDLAGTAGRISPASLLEALPRLGETCVLSWDRGDLLAVPPPAIDAALDAGRSGTDLVVVDLPRQPDEAAVHALQATDSVLLVVPAEVRACAAATRVATVIGPHCTRLSCIIRGPAPAGLRSRDLSDMLGLSIAGVLRPDPRLARALEQGEAPAWRGRGPLATLCRRLLADLDRLPAVA